MNELEKDAPLDTGTPDLVCRICAEALCFCEVYKLYKYMSDPTPTFVYSHTHMRAHARAHTNIHTHGTYSFLLSL